MKKRLISFLLAVLMVATLFSGMTVSASADATVTTVTLSSGQTVLGLCQKLGVDYYAHRNLIMTLNGLTSEAQFSSLPVGSQIVLPVSNAAASALAGSGTLTSGSTVGTTGTGGLTTGTASTLPTGDYVSYYLVNYTIHSGETIAGIYNNWGLSYKTYSNQILKLNNISNFNSIPAGKALWLPTTNPAVAGATYYTIMAHTMKSGESAYNIVCADYGLNYNSVQTMLQALNNRSNLANFYVGETLYIPVAGLVSANTNVTPGSGSSSTSGTVSPGTVYNLVAQTPANGSFDMTVNNISTKTAYSGQIVKITATPNTGYSVASMKVVNVADASVSVPVNSDGTFTMPSYSVAVSVTFQQATSYKLTVNSSGNGSVATMVSNARVDQAYVGSIVTVKTIPNTGFILDDIKVTYRREGSSIDDYVAVTNGSFVMPNHPVTVTASFKDDPNFDPTLGHNIYYDITNGKIETTIGTVVTSNAKVGERVGITVTPDLNYTLESLTVYYSDFTRTVDVEKNAFVMPDCPVTIVATVKPTADATFAITKVSNSEGIFALTVDGMEVSSAKVGQKVQITGEAYKSYYNFQAYITKTGDSTVSVPINEDNTFTMPDFPITVRLKFYTYHSIILDASNGSKGWFAVLAPTGMQINTCAAGVELQVTVYGYDQRLYTPSNVIVTYADGSIYTLEGSKFIMPDCDIKVRVNFNEVTTLQANPIIDPAGAGNSYTVLGKTIGDKSGTQASIIAAGFTGKIWITPNPTIGYTTKAVTYSYTLPDGTSSGVLDATPDPITEKYYFEMPAKADIKLGTPVVLSVSFKPIASYAIEVNYALDPYGNNSDLKKGYITPATEMGSVSSAIEGAKVTIRYAANSGYKFDPARVAIRDKNGVDVTTAVQFNRNDLSFFMPAYPVVIVPAFNDLEHIITVAEIPLKADGTRPTGILSVQLDGGSVYTDDQLNSKRELPVTVEAGTLVTVINESRDGYILRDTDPIVVTMVHGGANPVVTMVTDDRFSFQMPDDDVIIEAFYIVDTYNIVAMDTVNGKFEVPKQASWNGEEVEVKYTPDSGFMLDKITIHYYDNTGRQIDEVLTGNKFSIDLDAKPLSEVFVEVTFKPIPNRLSIKYQFNGTPDASYLYKVDLSVDNNPVDIERSYTWFTSDTPPVLDYNKYTDTVGNSTDGIPTGATVIIRRNNTTGRYDNNFAITDLFVLLNGSAVEVKKVEASGDYYFTMPPVTNTDKLELNVIFTKLEENKVTLVAIPSGGGEADVAFTDDSGNPLSTVTPGTAVNYTITPKTGSTVGDSVTATYTDFDGNTKEITVSSGSFTVPADAKSQTSVNVYYTVEPAEYTINSAYTLNGTAGSDSITHKFYAADGTALSEAKQKWGASNVVNVEPAEKANCSVDTVSISYTPADGSGAVTQTLSKTADSKYWQFSVPVPVDASGVTVTVNYVDTMYKVNIIKDEYGTTTPSATTFKANDTVTLTFVPNDGYKLSSLKVDGSDVDVSTLTNNTYTFPMPTNDVDVEVVYSKITYTISVSEGDAGNAIARDNTVVLVNGDGANPIDGNSTTTASVGDKITIVPKPGYMISSQSITYYDELGNLKTVYGFVDGGSYSKGRGISFVISNIPDHTINFSIALTAVAEAYNLTQSIEPNGSISVSNITYYKDPAHTTAILSSTYADNVYAVFTFDPSATTPANLSKVEFKFTDYLGNSVTLDAKTDLSLEIVPEGSAVYELVFKAADFPESIMPATDLRIVYTAS